MGGARLYLARSPSVLIFVGADVQYAHSMPVVGPVDHDDVLVLGVCARQADRQVVCLASRVDKKAHAELLWHRCNQFGGQLHQVLVQVASVRI